ncbi:MAG: hypothetical protein NTU49_04380, partial [Gammaproteobacteria bacterium]|nr:hypothetical protein [Gammaproteobacteria bacterium]
MDIKQLAKKIKLLILDVDGVLTDGKIYMSALGEETIAFYVQDGYGIQRLQSIGITIAIISGRNAPAVKHRLKKLNIHHVFLGHLDKINAYKTLLSELK